MYCTVLYTYNMFYILVLYISNLIPTQASLNHITVQYIETLTMYLHKCFVILVKFWLNTIERKNLIESQNK